jgi:F-type H+-transporting ATPase subunit delta
MQEKLKKSLEIRLQREVVMNFELDKNLLGGAIIRAGDWVVDGSVRSKLEKLKQAVVM